MGTSHLFRQGMTKNTKKLVQELDLIFAVMWSPYAPPRPRTWPTATPTARVVITIIELQVEPGRS